MQSDSRAQLPAPVYELSWSSTFQEGHSFGIPQKLVIAPDNTVCVLSNNAIWLFDSCGNFLDVWLSAYAINSIAISSEGHLFGLSTGARKVLIYDLGGNQLAEWGSFGMGDADFQQPTAIAVSPTGGMVYVTDIDVHKVKRYGVDGSFQLSWGGQGPSDGEFQSLLSIAVDSQGIVLVADYPSTTGRIQRFDSEGNFVSKLTGADFDANRFGAVHGMAQDALGNLYLYDALPGPGNRVWKFSADDRFITQWRGEGPEGGTFNYINGIAVNGEGSIFIAGEIIGNSGTMHKFLQPFVQTCPQGDFDGDCDSDAADFIAMTIQMTGPLQPAIIADASCLENDTANAGSYFSNGNDLHGYATQRGYVAGDWIINWAVESKPLGSGTVAIFDPNQLESAFVITAPAVAGEYVFRLTVSNASTGTQATDVALLTLEP